MTTILHHSTGDISVAIQTWLDGIGQHFNLPAHPHIMWSTYKPLTQQSPQHCQYQQSELICAAHFKPA